MASVAGLLNVQHAKLNILSYTPHTMKIKLNYEFHMEDYGSVSSVISRCILGAHLH